MENILLLSPITEASSYVSSQQSESTVSEKVIVPVHLQLQVPVTQERKLGSSTKQRKADQLSVAQL